MLSNLLCCICCGAPTELRNSGDVVAGLAADTQNNEQRNSEATGNRSPLGISVISSPGDAVADDLVSSSPRAQRKQAKSTTGQEPHDLGETITTMGLSSFYGDKQNPSTTNSASKQEVPAQVASQEVGENFEKDHFSKLDGRARPVAADFSSCFIELPSPFMAAALPVSALGAQLQAGDQTARAGINPGSTLVVPQPLLCGAGSGIQPMPRHVATSAEMQLSASLSEPLVHSGSPGSGPPDPHQCSSSMGTAVTATSGGEISTAMLLVGGTAAHVQSCVTLQQNPGCTAENGSAVGAQAPGSAATVAWGSAVPTARSPSSAVSALALATPNNTNAGRAADRTPLVSLGVRERARPLRGSLAVERSGGSRLGRPELAVLGVAAGSSTTSLRSRGDETEARANDKAEGAAAVATAVPTKASVTTGNTHAASGDTHAESGSTRAASGVGTSANTFGGVTQVGSQSSVGTGGGGSRGAGAFGMLGNMTRRLLHMVQDVGSVVSQVALMPAAASRVDSTAPAEMVAVAVVDAATAGGGGGGAAAEVPSDGGVTIWTAQSSADQETCEKHGPLPSQQSCATKSLLLIPSAQHSLNIRQVRVGQLQPQQQQSQQQQQQSQQQPQQQQSQQQPQQQQSQQQPQQQQLQQQSQQQQGASAQLVQPRSMHGQPAPSVAAGSGLYAPYVASRGSIVAGNSSRNAMLRRGLDDIAIVQLLQQHPPYQPYSWGSRASTSRMPKHAARDVSQVAMMQMLHFGSTSGRVPLQHLATLNVASLSREIRALHWIGQGGGGAVFQGVWQGAPVAVKFMLAARPEHVDATALEAIVSLAVGHPNVVTTYSFDVTRLTEASFMHDAAAAAQARLSQQPAAEGEDSSATALYNALMETETTMDMPGLAVGGGGGVVAGAAQRHRQHTVSANAAGAAGSGGGNSRPSSMHRMENLSTRLRRAQAAAALSGNAPVTTANGEEAVEGMAVASTDSSSPGQEPEGGCTAAGGRPAGGEKASRDPSPAQQQRSNAAAARYAEPLGIESIFNSEEGFGDPDLADNGQSWSVRHVLTYLKARPGMYMTHIIMEHCDRGSLMSAIKRGIFRMDGLPDDDGSPWSGGDGSIRGSAGAIAAMAAGTGAAGGSSDAPKFTKRVVLRALLRTARDIAQGMCHLHANGIIHGDLKPGNVLLRGCRSDRRGFTALVSDFGLSKVTRSDKPLELNHWSTVTVMAPEVIMGRWLKASDVFSFGILLWQLVTGEIMPYGNSTVQQVLVGVAQGTLKPEWPASAHPALVRLGRACLATSPEKRPSFEAIVKILTKIEQHVRNERRPPREVVDLAVEGSGCSRGVRHSRSSGMENATLHIKGSRSSAM